MPTRRPNEIIQWVKETLFALGQRKQAYQLAFRSPHGQTVLRDLAKFCRATTPPWGSNPQETARLVGRNEVWQRIMQHLNLTEAELYNTYGGQYPIAQTEITDE